MVNTDKVNALRGSVTEADFCEIFGVFADFYGLKNSVKYTINSGVNGATVQFCGNLPPACRILSNNIMTLSQGYAFVTDDPL
jgi:hypothetical protein